MENLESDIVIIGSGIAGAMIAEKLSNKKLKVLILEARNLVDRQRSFQRYLNAPIKYPECPYPEMPHAPFPKAKEDKYFIQKGNDSFKSTYLRVAGGTTWRWLGVSLRLIPDDFIMKSKYNVGVDWPISYDNLEPWYEQAEKEIAVAGANGEDLGSPRKNKYPMPEIPFTNLDQFINKSLANTPYKLTHTPQARNSVIYDDRSVCCGSSCCVSICHIQAKYDATVHLKKAEKNGAILKHNCVVYKIISNKEKQITDVKFKVPNGHIYHAKGKIFILAANAIENAKLLLMSKNEDFPNGIANRSDQVGRNLMDHPSILTYGLTPEEIFPYRAPLETAGIDFARNGKFRNDFAAYRLKFNNDGWSFLIGGVNPFLESLVESGLSGNLLEKKYTNHVYRQIVMVAMTEQLPDQNNRIIPSYNNVDSIGIPRPEIHYSIDSYIKKSFEDSRKKMKFILETAKCTELKTPLNFFGSGHIMGTHKMGKNNLTSVVDENLQSHDHPNLFIVGAGVMPTTGTANPTLTIAALSLRCSQFILNKYFKV